MKKLLVFGVLPWLVIYIIACMVDFCAGVCTDRVLFIHIFNSVFILPLCCLYAMAKKCTDIKGCFKVTLILPLVLPCAGLYTYLCVLGFKITVEQLVFAEMLFALASYLIIIPGLMLLLYTKSQRISKTLKNILNGFMAFVFVVEAVLGITLIISADEWQAPYEKYKLSEEFSSEAEGYDYNEKNGVTVEKWSSGKD